MAITAIGQGSGPLVCTPLTGTTQEILLEQLVRVLDKKPDIIEWRADFFAQISDTRTVLAMLTQLRQMTGEIPLIFTIRSIREGGHSTTLGEAAAIEMNAAVCRETTAEYVDCELGNVPEHIRYLRRVAADNGKKIIGSFHNFNSTPSREEIIKKLAEAENYQLDVAKVAVMPQNLEDVLTLLSATLEAKKHLRIPLITMSMGKFGAISRMVGGIFGSSLTFAVGAKASAPGQVPIEDLRTVLEIVARSMDGA